MKKDLAEMYIHALMRINIQRTGREAICFPAGLKGNASQKLVFD